MNNEELDGSVDDDDVNRKSQDLVQCPACLRRMQPSVFVKHPNVCRENSSQKRHRKVFDMTQYRAIKAGDKVLPVRKVSPINPDKSSANTNYNINTRPSQTRSAKRDRRSDAFVPPIISKFCMYTHMIHFSSGLIISEVKRMHQQRGERICLLFFTIKSFPLCFADLAQPQG